MNTHSMCTRYSGTDRLHTQTHTHTLWSNWSWVNSRCMCVCLEQKFCLITSHRVSPIKLTLKSKYTAFSICECVWHVIHGLYWEFNSFFSLHLPFEYVYEHIIRIINCRRLTTLYFVNGLPKIHTIYYLYRNRRITILTIEYYSQKSDCKNYNGKVQRLNLSHTNWTFSFK